MAAVIKVLLSPTNDVVACIHTLLRSLDRITLDPPQARYLSEEDSQTGDRPPKTRGRGSGTIKRQQVREGS